MRNQKLLQSGDELLPLEQEFGDCSVRPTWGDSNRVIKTLMGSFSQKFYLLNGMVGGTVQYAEPECLSWSFLYPVKMDDLPTVLFVNASVLSRKYIDKVD